MAKKVSVTLVDDVDGESVVDETITFAVDGHSYEIDLSGEHADQLRADFGRWVQHARRIRAARNGRASAGGTREGQLSHQQAAAIREWARRHGRSVAERGRIPKKVLEDFKSASSNAAGA